MSKAQDTKYDTRAPPRRRAKGEEFDDQPVFLRKAFAVFTSCPPEIGKSALTLNGRSAFGLTYDHLNSI